MKLKIEAELEEAFINEFGPMADKELRYLMKEAIYRTQRLHNNNVEDSKKVLTSNQSFDTI